MRVRRARGFTLLEVLVALLVVAIAVAALARVGAQSLSTQGDAEARTMALWVASNVIAELRLDPPAPGERRQGRSPMGQQDWHWEALIQPAPGNQMLRVDVAVFNEPGDPGPVLSHTGFLPL